MAGYTRQSTFTDGDTITAALFNNEFDHLLAVFSNATGHKHDGTASEGPVIGLIGDAGETTPNNKVLIDSANNHIEFYIEVSSNPVQQLYIADGAILPVTDNDIDLGSSSLEFKDLFIDGTANIDSLVADTADINGGTLDNVTIGATTAAAGTFTTVTTTSNVIVGGNLTVSGTTTTVNSNEVNIGDNIIVLNSDETGTPSQNGGIEIERGTSTNVSLVWNETNDYWTFGSNHLNFPDNSKAYFGTGNDLEIYHDGNHSRLKETGTGNFYFDVSNSLFIRRNDTSALMASFETGTAKLYFDNSLKLATASGGVTITGTATATAFSGPLTGNVTGDVTGNVAGNLTGSVLTAAQTNITSLGTLSSLAVSGDLTVDTSTLKVDSSNNRVGIGTASPSSLLHLNSGNRDLNFILADSPASGNAGVQITAGASDFLGLYGGSSNGELLLGSNNTERMRIDSSGNLGIGTSSPGARLQINGSSTDSSAHALIARNSGGTSLFSIRNDGRIDIPTGNLNVTNDVAVSGNLTVTGNATINGNLTFGDANTDTVSFGADIDSNIIPDDDNTYDLGSSSQEWKDLYIDGVVYADQIDLGDNERIRLGAGNDLQIYHNGSNSYIDDAGTGNLFIRSNEIRLNKYTGEFMLRAIADGAVTLYHDNSAKLATTSTGIDVTGGISASSTVNAFGNGSVALQWGDTTALGALSFDGSANPLIRSYSSKPLVFQTNGANERMRIDSSGNVGIGTTSPATKLDVSGSIRSTGDVGVAVDSSSNAYMVIDRSAANRRSALVFSTAASDTTGSPPVNSTIDWALGVSDSDELSGDKFCIQKSDTNFSSAAFVIDSSGNVGIGTTSPTDKVEVYANGADVALKIHEDAGTHTARLHLREGTQDTYIQNRAGNGFEIRTENNISTSNTAAMQITAGGDITTGYNLTVGGNLTVSGTTTTLNTATLDVEDKNITLNKGSGDTSSTADGAGITIQDAVDASNDATILWNASADRFDFSHSLQVPDNQRLRAGTGGDLQIYHNATDSYIENQNGQLYIRNLSDDKDIYLQSDNGSGGVQTYLFLDGSAEQVVFEKSARFTDNDKAIFGTGGDLEIYHDGSNSYIWEKGTGNLILRATDFRLQDSSGNSMAVANSGGGVGLYHNAAIKLDTTSTGISVTGSILADNSISVENSSGFGSIEVGGSSGAFIDLKSPMSDDYDLRIKSTGTGGEIDTATGEITIKRGSATRIATTASGIDVSGLLGVTSDSSSFIRNSTDNDLKFTFTTNNSSDFAQFVMDGKDGGGEKFLIAYGSTHASTPNMLALKSNDSSAGSIGFFTNSAERARFDTSGRLGIGTTSPSQKLDVAGIIQSTSTNPQVRINTSSGTGAGYLVFGDSGDDDRGWISYLHASDALQFRVNASERLRILSSGNVGIGTTSPSQPLDIRSASNIQLKLASTTSSNNSRMVFAPNNTEFWNIGTNISNGDFTFFDVVNSTTPVRLEAGAGNNTLVVDSNSRVGIGTTSPYEKLEVAGAISASGSVNALAAQGHVTSIDVASSRSRINAVDWGFEFKPFDIRASEITFGASAGSATERMRINSSGNVAIGHTSPEAKLDVDADSNQVAFMSRDQGSATYPAFGFAGQVDSNGNRGTGIFLPTDGALGFAAHSAERMRVNPTGVGIGTTSPTQALHVVGNGLFTGGLTVGDSAADTFITRGHTHLATSGNNVGIGTTSPSEKLHVVGDVLVGTGISYNASADDILTIGATNRTAVNNGTYFNYQYKVSGAATGQDLTLQAARNIDGSSEDVESIFQYDASADAQIFFTNGTERLRIDSSGTLTTPSGTDMSILSASGMTFGSTTSVVDFKTNNTQAMRIDTSQRVGIGTTSPATDFHVTDGGTPPTLSGTYLIAATSSSNAGIAINSGNSSASIIALGDTDSQDIGTIRYNHSDNSMRFKVNGNSDVFVINSSGEVNINQSNLVIEHASSPFIQLKDTTQNASFKVYAQNSDVHVTTSSNHPMIFDINNSEKMRLDTSGRLGIGTTSPAEKLHIDGSIRFTGSLKPDGVNAFEKQSSTIFVGDRDDNDLILDLSGFSESTAIEMNDGFMRFKSQGAEKIRMDSSGNLLVGTTTQNLSSSSFGTCLFPTGRAIHSRNVDGGASVMQIFGSAGECRILGDGDIQNTNNSYGGISDVRLKENIVDTDKKLDILNKVRIVDFNFIQKADTQTGVIAQELEEILPDLVSTGEDSYKTVKYSKFVPMLIKAIQEQQEEIEQLKKHSHSPKGLENMEGYESLVETIETLKAEIKLLQGGN